MFFLGLLIGAGVYFLGLYLWARTNSIWLPLIVAGLTVFVTFEVDINTSIGTVVCVIVLFLIGLYLGSRKESYKFRNKQRFYKNHCWNCGSDINSNVDRLCPRCGRHYICSKCGMCWCDDPRNKKH